MRQYHKTLALCNIKQELANLFLLNITCNQYSLVLVMVQLPTIIPILTILSDSSYGCKLISRWVLLSKQKHINFLWTYFIVSQFGVIGKIDKNFYPPTWQMMATSSNKIKLFNSLDFLFSQYLFEIV